MTQTYNIKGMTCEVCAYSVKHYLLQVIGVKDINVDYVAHNATVTSDAALTIDALNASLKDTKYSVTEDVPAKEAKQAWYVTYKPLLIIFGYLFIITTIAKFYLQWDAYTWMRYFEAGFFIAFSFFKMADIVSFARSFRNYDPLGKAVKPYSYLYPFIELKLGILFLLNVFMMAACIAVIVILSITTIGVINYLRKPTGIQCACLGTGFSLPLSYVTVVENVLMIGICIAILMHG